MAERIPFRDGIQNLMTQIGMQADNPTAYTTYTDPALVFKKELLDNMFATSWLARRMCEVVAEDMVRAGITITSDSLTSDEISILYKKMDELKVWNALKECITFSRLYGGCVGLFMIDGQDPRTPLNYKTVGRRGFCGIYPVDRWNILPSVNDLVYEYGPNFGQPKYYQMVMSDNLNLANISFHYTRLVKFVGGEVPNSMKQTYEYWGLPIISTAFDGIIAYDTALAAATQLLSKSYLRTLKVPGFSDMLVSNKEIQDAIAAQLNFLRLTSSNEGIGVIDGDFEMQAEHYTFAGISDVIGQMKDQLAGISEIPLTRLFGQTPAGFNSGESDIRMYYDAIASKQEDVLRKPLYTILNLIAKSYLGKVLEGDTDFSFEPLWQTNDFEKADIADKNSQTITRYMEAGVFSRKQALEEVKRLAENTGFGTTITQEDIDASDDTVPYGGEEDYYEEGIGTTIDENGIPIVNNSSPSVEIPVNPSSSSKPMGNNETRSGVIVGGNA